MNASRAKFGAALVIMLAVLAPEAPAASGEEVLYPGRIAFQSEPFPSFVDMDIYKSAVKKALLTKSITRTAKGDWTFHFVAFMRKQKAPQATRVNLVFYRQNTLVDFVEFGIDADARTLLAKATLQKERGFKSGDKLRAKVTVLERRGKGEREIVLADTGTTFLLE